MCVLYYQVMLDTTGLELLVINKGNHPIPLEADSFVVLTPDQEKEATSDLLPVNFGGLAKVIVYYVSLYLVIARSYALVSSRVYVVDTQKDPQAPTFHKVVEPADIISQTRLPYPHTAHCLASGDIMVSCLGDKDGKAEGNGFLLLDSDFNVKGRWEKPRHSPLFGYDYWYQPRHKTMISTSWGAPAAFTQGFNLQHVSDGLYGRHLHVYSWPEGEHVSDGLYGRHLHVYSWPEGEHV
ncbi:putative selenium-binding protein [Helianthus anomalus]